MQYGAYISLKYIQFIASNLWALLFVVLIVVILLMKRRK